MLYSFKSLLPRIERKCKQISQIQFDTGYKIIISSEVITRF